MAYELHALRYSLLAFHPCPFVCVAAAGAGNCRTKPSVTTPRSASTVPTRTHGAAQKGTAHQPPRSPGVVRLRAYPARAKDLLRRDRDGLDATMHAGAPALPPFM